MRKNNPPKNVKIKVLLALALLILGLLIVFLVYPMWTGGVIGKSDITSNPIAEKYIPLKFYDNTSSCPLDGELYLDNQFIGDTENGFFILTEQQYSLADSDSVFKLSGLTGNCFEKDNNLPFSKLWAVPDLKNYFQYGIEAEFNADANPREPETYEDIQKFVRPEEVEDYLNNLILKDGNEKNIDRIVKYRIAYISDKNLFGQEEYWQTPKETLERGMGDCEDWTVAVLSMLRNYNPELKCYAVIWKKHISIFCYYDNAFYIYDQGRTKFKATIDKDESVLEQKIQLRKMREDYFDDYGISPKDRDVYAVFNENELVTFEAPEDFINWMLRLGE